MKFAKYLQKDIYSTEKGLISSKINMNPYRSILIPEEILALYLKHLDTKEGTENIHLLVRDWCKGIIHSKFSSLSEFTCEQVFNTILKNIWCATGSMTNINAKKEDNNIIIQTENECITRLIGKNSMMPAFFEGTISALTNHRVILKEKEQGHRSRYVFSILEEDPTNSYTKLKSQTNSSKGDFNLKDALNYNLFILKNNKIFFKEKQLILIESSIFHKLPDTKEDIDIISNISYNFFNKLISEFHSTGKLVLLKKLLQSMGWGSVLIKHNKLDIQLQIKSMPKNALGSKENWNFFASIILGYMRSLDPSLIISSISRSKNLLSIYFNQPAITNQVEPLE